jgi:hypothetical protein
MNEVPTIHLPDGAIKVEKIIYKSDFEKIKKALKSISVSSSRQKKNEQKTRKENPAHS